MKHVRRETAKRAFSHGSRRRHEMPDLLTVVGVAALIAVGFILTIIAVLAMIGEE